MDAREVEAIQYLPNQAPTQPPPGELIPGFIIASDPMWKLIEGMKRVAARCATVLISGETGTGKELAARQIHAWSLRPQRPFTVIDCARLTDELAESELFGHERGAFTGASQAKRGLFDAAENGTVLLDEISELPLRIQAKLLRVLENFELRRVGSTAYHSVSGARIVAATNRNLTELVRTGRFREDLFYRLDVLRLHIPPLRERRPDIRALAAYFMGAHAPGSGLSHDALAMLEAHSWPGNVRDLKNFVKRVGAADSPIVGKAEAEELLLPPEPHAATETPATAASRDGLGELTFLEMKRRYFAALAARHGGNKSRMARASGVGPRTIYNWAKEFGLDGRPPGEA